MTDEKPGSAEMDKIKQVDAALTLRKQELENLESARVVAARQHNYVKGNQGDHPPEYYEAIIAAIDAKIGKVNARIKRLNELRELRKERHIRYQIAYGNAIMPDWWDHREWGKWIPEIGNDGVEK